MKIVGGSYGVKGSAYIARDQLVIEGARKAYIDPQHVRSVETRVDAERRFGFVGAAIGAILLAVLGTLFLGVVGALIGIAIAIAGSFYTTRRNLAELTFVDGSTLTLECTPRAIDKLVRFRA